MIFVLFVLLAIQTGDSEFVLAPVESVPVCITQNRIMTMGYANELHISGIAWPVSGPPISVPLTANGLPPTRTYIVCMGGCESPPCFPPTRCNPNDLWWNAEYVNLIVPPSSPILLPEMTNAPPPTLGVFFSPPSLTPSPNPSPSASTSATPSASARALTPVAVPPCQKDYTMLISLCVILTLFGAVLVGCAREIFIMRRRSPCPYCDTIFPRKIIMAHLRECQKHLAHYSPITTSQVTIVRETINIEEGEDQVARPEAVRLQTAFNNA
jgi:hypothetical protein